MQFGPFVLRCSHEVVQHKVDCLRVVDVVVVEVVGIVGVVVGIVVVDIVVVEADTLVVEGDVGGVVVLDTLVVVVGSPVEVGILVVAVEEDIEHKLVVVGDSPLAHPVVGHEHFGIVDLDHMEVGIPHFYQILRSLNKVDFGFVRLSVEIKL